MSLRVNTIHLFHFFRLLLERIEEVVLGLLKRWGVHEDRYSLYLKWSDQKVENERLQKDLKDSK